MKYLILLALLAYVYHAWRKQRLPGRGRPGQTGAATRGASGHTDGPQPQAMVACAACGLHVPQAEALADGRGRLYCSPRHRDPGSA